MAYVEKYHLFYSNPDGERFLVLIEELDYVGDPIILKPSTIPVEYKLIDNEENPYLPIQASELSINFISESNFSLFDLFTAGSLTDTKYKVFWYHWPLDINMGRLLWIGWLDTESCSEQILDDPRIVSLRAVDGLGFLKNDPFTGPVGVFQYGKYTLLQCIEWCLVNTELLLDLWVGVSIFEESMTDRTTNPASEPFAQCKIHTRSLKSLNSYEVLQEICRAFSATLYQANGLWHIERKHDRWNNRLHIASVYVYPYVDAAPPTSVEYTYRHTLFAPINADHNRFFLPPFKKAKTTYKYTVPEDIPRNSNFQEGTFISLISDGDNTAYTIDYWTLVKNIPEVSSTATPYRNDNFDPVSDKLIESTVRIPRDVAGTANGNRLRAEAVEVNVGDRLNISAQTRARFSYSVSDQYFNVFYVRLVGISATIYTLQDQGNTIGAANDSCTWQTGTGATVQVKWPPSADSMTWQGFDITSTPFPEDGELFIYFMGWDSAVTSNETWFKNIKIGFELFMGATTNLVGQEATINQTSTFRGQGELNIVIGDAPKKIISGALFRVTDDTELTTLWTIWNLGLLTSPPMPLLQLTNRAQFQLRHRFKTKVEGTIKGLTYDYPALDGTKTTLFPQVEMEYAPVSMDGIKYIPTNLTLASAMNTANVFLMEFYNSTEDEDPVGDSETLEYLYE